MLKYLFLLLLLLATPTHAMRLVTLESPPEEFLEAGLARGSNIELVTEAFRRLNTPVSIEFVPWCRALHMVRGGQADGVIDAAKSPEREEYLSFPAAPLHIETWYAFQRDETNFTLAEDLSDAHLHTLAVVRGFEYGEPMRTLLRENRFKSVSTLKDNHSALRYLLGGRCDLAIGIDSVFLFLASRQGPEARIKHVTAPGSAKPAAVSTSPTYIAFSKLRVGEDFVARFSTVLEAMTAEGLVDAVHAKYAKLWQERIASPPPDGPSPKLDFE